MSIQDTFAAFSSLKNTLVVGKDTTTEHLFSTGGAPLINPTDTSTSIQDVEVIETVQKGKKVIPTRNKKNSYKTITFRIPGLKNVKIICSGISVTENGLMIVVEDFDSLPYTPEPGDTLNISVDKVNFEYYYYPGTVFQYADNWYLIFVKTTEAENE